MNFGFKVSITFVGGLKIVYRNVTEIHYNYPSDSKVLGPKVAFESDVHSTGCTHPVEEIFEFDATLEASEAGRGFYS